MCKPHSRPLVREYRPFIFTPQSRLSKSLIAWKLLGKPRKPGAATANRRAVWFTDEPHGVP